MPKVLLVIPAYRESARLPAFAHALCDALDQSKLDVDVQVVDDGSPSADALAVSALCGHLAKRRPGWKPLKVLAKNSGKGAAVYAGWDSADDAAWLGFCDADGSVPANEVARLIAEIGSRDDRRECVIASRAPAPGKSVRRSFWRRIMSSIFVAWVQRCLRLKIADTQCGCKFLPTDAYRVLRPGLHEHRFAFDVELLGAATKVGLAIREVPVNWFEKPGGSLRLWSDGFAMIVAVWRMRVRPGAGHGHRRIG